MDVFSHKKYKDIIILSAKERREQFGQRFSLAKVADACGVQKTYLSKILNSESHLNADQLAAACEFLNCNETETEYILLLREQETATHPFRIKSLAKKIEALIAKARKTSAVLQGATTLSQQEIGWIYYSDVSMQLVHLFLTIPAFQKDLGLIEKALGLSQERLIDVILKLEKHGLAAFDGKTHTAIDFNFHLDPSSPVFRPYRTLQRLKSLDKIDKIQGEDSCYALTAAFASDQSTFESTKLQILQLVKNTQKSVIASSAESVFQLNIDFFRWDP